MFAPDFHLLGCLHSLFPVSPFSPVIAGVTGGEVEGWALSFFMSHLPQSSGQEVVAELRPHFLLEQGFSGMARPGSSTWVLNEASVQRWDQARQVTLIRECHRS